MKIIELSREEIDLVDQFYSIYRQRRDLEALEKTLRKKIDAIVEQNPTEDNDEPIRLETPSSRIGFGKVSKKLKLVYDVEEFLIETKLFEAVTISTTKATDKLSKADVAKYFKLVPGSRNISVK